MALINRLMGSEVLQLRIITDGRPNITPRPDKNPVL
jgi:hypothetical protein